jgi:hypothetical protein
LCGGRIAQHNHARRNTCAHAHGAVFDRHACVRRNADHGGGMQVHGRIGFARPHVLAGGDAPGKPVPEAGRLQLDGHARMATGRCHSGLQAPLLHVVDHGCDAGDGFNLAGKTGVVFQPVVLHPVIRHAVSQPGAHQIIDCRHRQADKALGALGLIHRPAQPGQRLRQQTVGQRFGIHQHPVTVKDHRLDH